MGVAEAVRAVVAARQPKTAASLMGLLSRPVAVAPDGARALLALGEARVVERAAAPRRPDGGSNPRDVALAEALAGARVKATGEVERGPTGGLTGALPVWCVDFGGVSPGAEFR